MTAPELVALLDDPDGPYGGSPEAWWVEYGGTLDEASGVIAFPAGALPPCPLFPECSHCAQREGA